MKKTLFFLFLIISLLSSSCHKDDPIGGGPDSTIYVQTQLMGVIRDENDEGLEGVGVRWGQQIATTDENGFYTFAQASADEEGTILQITANGYFDLTKTVVPIPNGRTWMEAMLTPKVLRGTVQASAGGTVTFSGASVYLPAGGIVGSGNMPYTGTVNVYATWLDPTNVNTLARMPGNLTAIRENGDQATLASYGMIGVELESLTGAPLQLAQGAQAQVEIMIPAALVSNAPASIPLWHFDVTKGKWMGNGFAEKVGSTYVGSLSHFSFWNLDVPFDNANLSGRIVNSSGLPLMGVRVKASLSKIGSENIPTSASAYTNSKGKFSGKVPAEEILLIQIIDQCGEVIYDQQVGPISSDLNMGDLVVDLSDKSIEITGTLLDCNNLPVSDGYIKIQVYGKSIILPTSANGTIQAAVTTCFANKLTASGYDLGNLKVSPAQTHLISGLSELNLGNLVACDELEEFIEYTLDGVTVLSTEEVYGTVIGSKLIISTSINAPDSSFLFLTVEDYTVGDNMYSAIDVTAYNLSTGNYITGWGQGPGEGFVTITKVGEIGEYILGSFEAVVGSNNPAGKAYLVGSFRVIRD